MSTLENNNYKDLLKVIVDSLGPDLLSSTIQYGELTIQVYCGSIVRVLAILKDHPDCLFRLLVDVCGVDYPDESQRFRVVYHLLSVEHNHRIRVKISTDETIPVPSVTPLFSGSNWFEREVFDMYGVQFSGHPDLRRILTDYEFEGYPLRKDFPTTGYVETRYDPALRKVVYEPVSLQQEYRNFDFMSPWEGMMRQSGAKETKAYGLPGDEKSSLEETQQQELPLGSGAR